MSAVNRHVILDRTLVHPEFVFIRGEQRFNRSDLFERIDQWKTYLFSLGLKPGERIGFALTEINLDYFAFFFAAVELGIVIVVLDWDKQIGQHSSRLKDILPLRYFFYNRESPSVDFYAEYSIVKIDLRNIHLSSTPLNIAANVRGKDPLMMCFSSGTTGTPKKIYHTHAFMRSLAERNTILFEGRQSAIHFLNFHHGSSFATYFLPSLHACRLHVGCEAIIDMMIEECRRHQIESIQFPYPTLTDAFLKALPALPENKIRVFTLTYQTPDWVRLLGRGVRDVISIFGASETSGPVFVSILNEKRTTFDPRIFEPLDRFYKIEIRDEAVHVSHESGIDFTFPDTFKREDNGAYYHVGRQNFMRINDTLLDQAKMTHWLTQLDIDGMFVFDPVFQKLYLVLWSRPASENLEVLRRRLAMEVGNRVYISAEALLEKENFVAGIKVDVELLRDHFRNANHNNR